MSPFGKWCGVLLAVLLWHRADAAEYSGSGSIVYRFPMASPTNRTVRILSEAQFSFKFSVSNKSWQIGLSNKDAKSGVLQMNVACDGTNTYRTSVLSKESYESLTNIDKSRSTNVVGQIFPTVVPPSSFFPVTPVWLAFCSGSYIQKITDGMVRPLWQFSIPSATSLDFSVHSSYARLNDAPLFLKELTQFSDGKEYEISVVKQVPRVKPMFSFPGAFSNGFPRVKYWVVQATNVAGASFPRQFRFQQLGPDPLSSSTNLEVICEYEGVLDDLYFGRSDVEMTDQICRFASVVDYRTLKLSPACESVTYQSPSNTWLPMAPKSLPYGLYLQTVAAQKNTPEPEKTRKVSVYFLIALFLLPLVFIFNSLLKKLSGRVKSQK